MMQTEVHRYTAFELVYDAIFVYDFPKQSLIDINHAGRNLLNKIFVIPNDENTLHLQFRFGALFLEKILKKISYPIGGQGTNFVRKISDRFGNKSWLKIYLNQVDQDESNLIFITIRNITKDRFQEREIKALNTELYKANKLQTLGGLALGVAHDFKNILSGIMGYVQLANDEFPEGTLPETFEYLERALFGCNRARNLADQILAFTKHNALRKMPINLETVLNEVLTLLKATLPVGIKINSTIADESLVVFANEAQLFQIIINFCTNAVQAMPGNRGTLEIELNRVNIRSEQILGKQVLSAGEYVKLRVKDSGTGMPPEIKERIFEPLFTSKKATGNSGIGLWMVSNIVKNHGGAIEVFSKIGFGTIFDTYFPCVERQDNPMPQKYTQLPTGQEMILIVDDEPFLVDILQRFLKKLGYRIITANDGTEALRLFKLNARQVQLVITDQVLPDLNGTDLAKKLRSMKPHLPIILCTEFGEKEIKEKSRELNIRVILKKPVDHKKLAVIVRESIDSDHKKPSAPDGRPSLKKDANSYTNE